MTYCQKQSSYEIAGDFNPVRLPLLVRGQSPGKRDTLRW